MNAGQAIRSGFSRWSDDVASTIVRLREGLSQPRTVSLIQDRDDEFLVHVNEVPSAHATAAKVRLAPGSAVPTLPADLAAAIAGSRVELVLKSDQFLFRALELPRRASEFLPGIVRAQIDRLTPWDAGSAAFGWTQPIELTADRMSITIAATPVSLIKPWLDVIAALGVHSVAVLTAPPPGDGSALPIKVWDQRSDALGLARIRKTLVTSLAACGIAAAVTMATAAIVETTVENYDAGVTDKLKAIRGAAGRDMDGSLASAKRALERRKYASPSAVMVLDALSEILPDHTYVTELRVEANKVRLTGITRDAPSLIELIEKSGRFTRASFFGPTTRSASEPGERFNIEAIIQPIAPVRS